MDYSVKEITIRELVDLINNKRLELHPPYQRNFIWTAKDQRMLIDSIMKGYPLPTFFIYQSPSGEYEMVDGQQRATTICNYINGEFASSNKRYYREINKALLLEYRLGATFLYNIDKNNNESLEEFYSLVNKRGVHLNPAEINKAQYHDTSFLAMIDEIMEWREIKELELFSKSTIARMNDRSLIEEVVAYLFEGIQEKRDAVEHLFESTLDEGKIDSIKDRFKEILDVIIKMDCIKRLNTTRFKQRNDFYTLCCFIDEHLDQSDDIFVYQYKTLELFDESDFIRPSNDYCDTFYQYAVNCVTQSNSKAARIKRLYILNQLLCNPQGNANNREISDVLRFLKLAYGFTPSLISIGNYSLINIDELTGKELRDYDQES